MRAAVGSYSPPARGNSGYPLGEAVITLNPVPTKADVDIACEVVDAAGRNLASITTSRPRAPSVWGRESEDLEFVMVIPSGAQRLRIIRLGGVLKAHQIVVCDPSGSEVGRLRQTSSSWRQFRSPRLTMALESHGHALGSTDICIDPDKQRFAEVATPVLDVHGGVLATVQRAWRYVDTVGDFFAYRLTCPRPYHGPLPDLLLATAFGHYLYDRLVVGGPLSSYNRFGRGGTWHDPRDHRSR